ncbi:uncharacterized protein BDZ99DRAFT_475612 [Mytilinidion resinicola]|uniref:Uncharacterized protein n=1 Tax=Mytilinidion resinicola TaxID=574789 RepID=A0A6A6YS26_9PEZI|nr:uncharacterized protein BDZ99DRAFT_475612 [Mytilinidion resinicola]KAF2810717.1 hypothetical protein BDZ99DRAFT_475612 [Mytilinidion resinicola]
MSSPRLSPQNPLCAFCGQRAGACKSKYDIRKAEPRRKSCSKLCCTTAPSNEVQQSCELSRFSDPVGCAKGLHSCPFTARPPPPSPSPPPPIPYCREMVISVSCENGGALFRYTPCDHSVDI